MSLFKTPKGLFVIFVCLCFGCASYHTKSLKYQAQVQDGLIEDALKNIESNKFLKKKRNLLLYYLEKGKVAHLKNDFILSNELFNKADILIEDFRKEIGDEILGVVTNPERTVYRAEDFEKVAIHYYKALNYIFLNKLDDALVEAKRINLQLHKINEKYPADKKNRYTSDAFSLNLQGLLYEASGSINDAFISYRNSVDLYLKEKGSYFGVAIPRQLKIDLLRTANSLGFYDEEERYSKLLDINYTPVDSKFGEAIIFWENGLVPYKDQTFYSFSTIPGEGGILNINNEELGLNLYLPPVSGRKRSDKDISDLEIFNVSFPKYVSRKSYYNSAKVVVDSTQNYPFELVQNYNKIAFKTLKDRTLREIGKIALRLVTKKTSEYILRNQNEDLGALLGFFNALTERSDTRNWQTLPNTISYVRFPLKEGENKINLVIERDKGKKITKNLVFEGTRKLKFLNYATLKILN